MKSVVLGIIGLAAAIIVAACIETFRLTTEPPKWLVLVGVANIVLGAVVLWLYRNVADSRGIQVALLRGAFLPLSAGLAVVCFALRWSALGAVFAVAMLAVMALPHIVKLGNDNGSSGKAP